MSDRARLSDAQRRARLARRHRLVADERTDDVVAIAESLVCLHSSDPASVYLSAAARMNQPSIDAVADALFDSRALVRHHAMRSTLWVFTPVVARLAHASSTEKLVGPRTRVLHQLLTAAGVDDPVGWTEQACAEVRAAVERLAPVATRTLGDELEHLRVPLELAPGKPYGATQPALNRVLQLLAMQGHIARGRQPASWVNSQYAWEPMSTWLPDGVDGLDRDEAAAGLVGRYLARFGPATLDDVQWWTGWTKTLTRTALGRLDVVEVDLDDGSVGLLLADDTEPIGPVGPWVALLPGLDPTTMGWKSRDWYLDPELVPAMFDRNGNGGPAILADGRIVGAWAQRPDGEIATKQLVDVDADTRAAVEIEVARLTDVIGDARFKARFPAPSTKELQSS